MAELNEPVEFVCDDCSGSGECPNCGGVDPDKCDFCFGSGECPECEGVGPLPQ